MAQTARLPPELAAEEGVGAFGVCIFSSIRRFFIRRQSLSYHNIPFSTNPKRTPVLVHEREAGIRGYGEVLLALKPVSCVLNQPARRAAGDGRSRRSPLTWAAPASGRKTRGTWGLASTARAWRREAAGVDQVAVACLFCMNLLEDARGAGGAADLAIRDVAEIVADGVASGCPALPVVVRILFSRSTVLKGFPRAHPSSGGSPSVVKVRAKTPKWSPFWSTSASG
jgi:hypothetical protein